MHSVRGPPQQTKDAVAKLSTLRRAKPCPLRHPELHVLFHFFLTVVPAAYARCLRHLYRRSSTSNAMRNGFLHVIDLSTAMSMLLSPDD
eukprot:6207188-Pleurochrysis_carterae.AAC.2